MSATKQDEPVMLELSERVLSASMLILELDVPPEGLSRAFVEVELASLENVRVQALQVEVRTVSPDLLLGTFAPFPANKPGTFIVAIQRKLRAEQTLRLVLRPLADADLSDVRVTVAAVRLRD